MSRLDTMRVLVTGSRDWLNITMVETALADAAADTPGRVTLVCGDCPTGADYYARRYACRCGWAVEVHRAEWGRYGRSAGPRRNTRMVASGADVCLAFIRNNSSGASGCSALAEAAGIPTTRYWESDTN